MSNRLRHMFAGVGVDPAVFGTFDRYCAAHPTATPAEAALARVAAVQAGFTRLVDPPVGMAMMVGYFMDLHVPLLLQKPARVFEAYRRGIAPDQCGAYPVVLGGPGEMHHPGAAAVERVVAEVLDAAEKKRTVTTPAGKLFAKGRPNPKSVRYIRPQLQRCVNDAAAFGAADFLLRVDGLKATPHERKLVPMRERLKIYGNTLAELVDTSCLQPSRSLYTIIAKCMAAVIARDPPLLLKASRAWGVAEVSAYVRLHTTGGVSVDRRRPHQPSAVAPPWLAFVRGVHAEFTRHPIRQFPLHHTAVAKQAAASAAHCGLLVQQAWACTFCGIVAVRPRECKLSGAKERLGVSVCMADPSSPAVVVCNNCKQTAFTAKVCLSANVTKARLTGGCKQASSIVVCSTCAEITAAFRMVGVDPICTRCAPDHVPPGGAVSCICGTVRSPRAVAFIANCPERGPRVYAACDRHIWMLPTEHTPALCSTEEYARLIRCNRTSISDRLKD